MKFNLQKSDFEIEEEHIKVTSIWVDPEFQRQQELLGNVAKKKEPPVLRTCFAIVSLGTYSLRVEYDPDSINETSHFYRKLNETLDYIQDNIEIIIDKTADMLLDVKNTEWLETNECKYSKSNFRNSIGKLKNIQILCGSEYVLWFDDGDLFCSHDIEVRMKSHTVIEALISG